LSSAVLLETGNGIEMDKPLAEPYFKLFADQAHANA
jgi:hypothetical protein